MARQYSLPDGFPNETVTAQYSESGGFINETAGSGATTYSATLSPVAFAFAVNNLGVIQTHKATLSPLSYSFALNNLGAAQTRKATLSPVTYALSIGSLSVQQTHKATLSPLSYAFAVNNLGAVVTRKVTLNPAAFNFAVNDLAYTITAATTYSVTLSPVTFSFALQPLQTQYTAQGGGGRDGHGKKSNNRLPYGWWADPEYNPKLRSKKPLTETEKEVIREAVAETDEPGEPVSLAANLLASLILPYEQNDRIDWQAIDRSNDEIKALRQGIAAYRKALQEQAEEDEDEEALLMLAH